MVITNLQRLAIGSGTIVILMVSTLLISKYISELWQLLFYSVLLISSVFLVMWWRSLKPKKLDNYKNIKIIKFQEWPHTWSIHIRGSTPFSRHVCRAKLKARFTFSTDPYPNGAKLFTDKVDRQQLERCSLRAFAGLLGAVALDPHATVISSSVLNFKDRNPQRLSDRIRIVMEHKGQWQYEYIMRTQPALDSFVGRLFWGWKKRPGDKLLATRAPGIMVWHSERPRPQLPPSIKIIKKDMQP